MTGKITVLFARICENSNKFLVLKIAHLRFLFLVLICPSRTIIIALSEIIYNIVLMSKLLHAEPQFCKEISFGEMKKLIK